MRVTRRFDSDRSLLLRTLALGFGCLLLSLGSAEDVRAYSDSFKLTVSAGYYYGQFVEPVDRVFRVRKGFPGRFYVTVTNVSSSTELFYEQAASSGYSSIIFEISDKEGNSNVIRRKNDPNASSNITFTYMKPGQSKVFVIALNENEWENAFKLIRQGANRVRVRAIYEIDFKRIYSDYYEVIIIDLFGGPNEEAGTNKEEPSVLISK